MKANIICTLIIAVVVLFSGYMINKFDREDKIRQEWLEKAVKVCDDAGGVVIEGSYCVKKEAIIKGLMVK